MDPETAKASMNIGNFGPWIISSLALLQTWVIWIWRWFRKPKISIYESGNIEIGFSNFGQTIGLNGTLRVLKKSSFIKNMSLDVTRERDSAKHTFNWRVFRPLTFTINPQPSSTPIEIASSFLLTQEKPFKYNILFIDDGSYSRINSQLAELHREWLDFRNNKLQKLEEEYEPNAVEQLINNPLLDEKIYQEFTKLPKILNIYTNLDRDFYWQQGNYTMSLSLECSKPDQKFTKEFKFTLSNENVDELRLNTIAILRIICGLDVIWNFAYPEYD